MVVESEQTGRRHVQPPMSRGAKPAGYWVSEEIRILLRRPYEIEFRFRFS